MPNVQPGTVGSQGGGALQEYSNPNFQIPGAQLPSQNPALQNSFNNQLSGAQNYLQNLQSNSDALYNTYASTARSQLPSLINQNRQQYNANGLLNSGMEKGAEANTVSGVNQQLAQTRSQINQGLNTNLNAMEGGAFQTAGLLAAPGPQTAQTQLAGIGTSLNAASQGAMTNAGLIGSILGGVGSVAGGTLAGAMQSNGNNPTLNNSAYYSQPGGSYSSPLGINYAMPTMNNPYSVTQY